MASDPSNTGAAFTHSLELDVIKIQDLNTETKVSVTPSALQYAIDSKEL